MGTRKSLCDQEHILWTSTIRVLSTAHEELSVLTWGIGSHLHDAHAMQYIDPNVVGKQCRGVAPGCSGGSAVAELRHGEVARPWLLWRCCSGGAALAVLRCWFCAMACGVGAACSAIPATLPALWRCCSGGAASWPAAWQCCSAGAAPWWCWSGRCFTVAVLPHRLLCGTSRSERLLVSKFCSMSYCIRE